MSSFANKNSSQPMRYNRLTAQIIKSSIKKRIYELRRRKNNAANDILDQLEDKLIKSIDHKQVDASGPTKDPRISPKNVDPDTNAALIDEIAATIAEGINLADKLSSNNRCREISIEELVLKILRSNRREAEGLLLQLSEVGDAEAISCFATNLIYGGFLTETAGNASRISYIEIPENLTPGELTELQNHLKRDASEGRRICILRGRSLLRDKLIGFYRYFSDTAFILVDSSEEQPQVQGIFNVLYISELSSKSNRRRNASSSVISGIIEFNGNRTRENTLQRSAEQGIKSNFATSNHFSTDNAISSLFKFLSSPSLPIQSSFDEFFSALCYLERMISKGNNTSPIIYKI